MQVRVQICRSCGSSPVDQFFLFLFPALISGRLFDLGYFRSTLVFASINLVVCTVLVAECHEFWQLLLCQGFGVGVSLHPSSEPPFDYTLFSDVVWSSIWTRYECPGSLV
jgi:hypothetical protein